MAHWLSREDMKKVAPADRAAFRSPVPTQVVSNGEFTPLPQTRKQKLVEHRIVQLADTYGKRMGLSRRDFLKTTSGMAVAFLAMNQVYGSLFDVSEIEATDPDAAAERASSLSSQSIFDDQLHFVRDDFSYQALLGLGVFASKHWNPAMVKDLGIELRRYKFENFLKEVFLDSDTKAGLLSGAPFDDPASWLLTNDQITQARDLINRVAGSRRLLSHAIFTPGQDGWMEQVEYAIERLKPDAWKGYTVGDPLQPSRYPWRLDDEKLVYPFYEKIRKADRKSVV